MARSRGYKLNPSRSRPRPEFMCDFTWLKWRQFHQVQIERIGLAAESEWSHKHGSATADFRKLIFIKAPVKLFICQVRSRDDAKFAKHRRTMIEKLLSATKVDLHDETYLILELHRNKENGKKQEPPHLFYWTKGNSEFTDWPEM